jgi:hypothetical protein
VTITLTKHWEDENTKFGKNIETQWDQSLCWIFRSCMLNLWVFCCDVVGCVFLIVCSDWSSSSSSIV